MIPHLPGAATAALLAGLLAVAFAPFALRLHRRLQVKRAVRRMTGDRREGLRRRIARRLARRGRAFLPVRRVLLGPDGQPWLYELHAGGALYRRRRPGQPLHRVRNPDEESRIAAAFQRTRRRLEHFPVIAR